MFNAGESSLEIVVNAGAADLLRTTGFRKPTDISRQSTGVVGHFDRGWRDGGSGPRPACQQIANVVGGRHRHVNIVANLQHIADGVIGVGQYQRDRGERPAVIGSDHAIECVVPE